MYRYLFYHPVSGPGRGRRSYGLQEPRFDHPHMKLNDTVETRQRHVQTFDASTRPSVAIVESVCERRNDDPVDLEPPLYDILDPDALDTLLDPTGSVDELVLDLKEYGCRVRVAVENGLEVRVVGGA